MELAGTKKNKTRKRKRYLKNKQRRVRRKLEVKGTGRRKFSHNISTNMTSEESQSYSIGAHTFWENYKVAQDWQQRHSVAWWKSRCYALEHENDILRQKVRSQANHIGRRIVSHGTSNKSQSKETINWPETGEEAEKEEEEDNEDENNENFEFHVDKDMLDFLEQSIRHKMELKRLRKTETESPSTDTKDDAPFVTSEARIQAKTKDAQLLYGSASPRIMAMEAALQATIDRHRDRASPHYWPNIPLKP
ncbi:gem-associated protein 8-like [Venturia canescens]|uniref:gem-associated protein 8-like n=1 Tax=Venturia canescens TaxID=32260 RepID=UPI001C9D2721|nr:gem-associated protein 8-like [Venturia canescens]